MGSRSKKRRLAEATRNPLAALVPPKRSEPAIITMLRNVAPVVDAVADEDGEVDHIAAAEALEGAARDALQDLRAQLAVLDRFDAIKRLAIREVAHDAETYVESEHDGLVSVLMLVMSVVAEFEDVGPANAEPCTQERIEDVHTRASAALQLALLAAAFRRSGSGGLDAARLVLTREVNWGPPSWPEDHESLLSELFSGVGGRVLQDVTGFSADELFAVTDAMQTAAEYLTLATLIEPRPFRLARQGLYSLAEVEAAAVDRVIDWFGTPLSQEPVVDVLEAARSRRMKPILVSGDQICWGTPDLLSWAVQLSFEEVLKGSASFNPYQRHRAKVVERHALRMLAEVLNPDAAFSNLRYTGSHGDGELDGLLLIDRVAIVVEAKGQMLSARARTGDPTRLEHNLGEIIGKASEQIGRFIRTLRDDGRVHLPEAAVTLDASAVDRVFGVIATLDELNSLAVGVQSLSDLGVVVDGDAVPTVLSLHGLTEACRLLDRPWSLLHYLHRRRETARRVEVFAPEELDVLMLHLRKNLFFDDVPEGTLIHVGVETDPLDAWSYYRRGSRVRPARKPTQKLPLHFQRLVEGLERERPEGWSNAVLHLLDLGASGRSGVNRLIKESRDRMRQDQLLHDFTVGTESPSWHGISVVLAPTASTGIAERMHFLTHLNGLRHDAMLWIGVAAEVDGTFIVPRQVLVARPPYDQVVPAEQVAPSVAWAGARRVMVKGSRRR